MPETVSPLGDVSSVELLDKMGSDLTVVNAARVSYAKRSNVMAVKDEKLISYLMRHKHGTPFEHVVLQYRVRAPLFVVHQWERHRMSSYNEESGRYIELRGDFYVPEDSDHTAVYAREAQRQYKVYQDLINAGEVKERARMVLGGNLYKEFWWTVNSRSLMNFIGLRNDEHAQIEIQRYAQAVETLFEDAFPRIAQAFRENNRVAP